MVGLKKKKRRKKRCEISAVSNVPTNRTVSGYVGLATRPIQDDSYGVARVPPFLSLAVARFLKGNGGVQRFPQIGQKLVEECKDARKLDRERPTKSNWVRATRTSDSVPRRRKTSSGDLLVAA